MSQFTYPESPGSHLRLNHATGKTEFCIGGDVYIDVDGAPDEKRYVNTKQDVRWDRVTGNTHIFDGKSWVVFTPEELSMMLNLVCPAVDILFGAQPYDGNNEGSTTLRGDSPLGGSPADRSDI